MTISSQKEYECIVASNYLSLLNENVTIIHDSRENPDFLLCSESNKVGLELVSYREQGPRNEVHDHNWKLRRFICDEWIDDITVHHYDVSLIYRMSGDRFLLPKKSCWAGLLYEIKTIAQSLPRLKESARFSIELHEKVDERFVEFLSRRQMHFLVGTEYPILCQHFRKLSLSYHPGLIVGWPCTSASSGNTGADTEELRKILDGKLNKAPSYREAIPSDAELWLLIHSDGWPMSAHIANDIIMNQLIDKANTILRESGEFTRVYWLENAYVQPFGPLHPVYMKDHPS